MQNYIGKKRNEARDKMKLKTVISLFDAAYTHIHISHLYVYHFINLV